MAGRLKYTKRAPRRTRATGGRPSSSVPAPAPANVPKNRTLLSADEVDDLIESLVLALGSVIREEFQRVRPVLAAGLEAGANYRLCSPSAIRRLRERAGLAT